MKYVLAVTALFCSITMGVMLADEPLIPGSQQTLAEKDAQWEKENPGYKICRMGPIMSGESHQAERTAEAVVQKLKEQGWLGGAKGAAAGDIVFLVMSKKADVQVGRRVIVSSREPIAVFSTQEKADAFIKTLNRQQFPEPSTFRLQFDP